ncbi:MAG: hypothetical protein JXR95_01890 [Deltaproteobacteria bacterium]|nr:hypothetical protein [Deltaproteobacteria bacterium]
MSGKFTVFVMKCPNCGANIEGSEGESIITCSYCQNTLRLSEKQQPAEESKKESDAGNKQTPPYQFNSNYLEAQKQIVKTTAKAGKTAAVLGVTITLLSVGGVIFGSFFMQNKVQTHIKDRQNETRRRIENDRIKRERERWEKYREKDSEALTKKMKMALSGILKEMKFPVYGNSKATKLVIEFGSFTGTGISRQKEISLHRRKFLRKFKEQLKWVYIPSPTENLSKSGAVTFLFEFFNKKGRDGFELFLRKLMRNNRWTWDKKALVKYAVSHEMDKKTALKLLNDKDALDILKKLRKVSETLDIPENESALVINDRIYRGYTIINNFKFIMENELGMKQ